jgi:hypothetical protein
MLALNTMVAAADEAVHHLRAAPANEAQRAVAMEMLKELQRLAWGVATYEEGRAITVRDQVYECDIALTRFAACAHWAIEHQPDGSALWDEGVARAGSNAVAERKEAGNLALSWQALYQPERLCVGTPGIRTFEMALDQEKLATFSMAPPPSLLQWLRDQPAAVTPVVRTSPLDGRYVGDGGESDAESEVDEDDEQQPISPDAAQWHSLDAQNRAAARLLGFTRRTWDASPRHVCVPWSELIADELSAAQSLEFSPATWDAQLQVTADAEVSICDDGCAFFGELLGRANAMEATLQEVRAHPKPSGEAEPNNASQDRGMCAWQEVEDSGDKLAYRRRSRAWLWYQV